MIIKKIIIPLKIYFQILENLNTFLFRIINKEKYKVIVIKECPLGKLGSVSMTKAFNIGGLGEVTNYLSIKVSICPINTFATKK